MKKKEEANPLFPFSDEHAAAMEASEKTGQKDTNSYLNRSMSWVRMHQDEIEHIYKILSADHGHEKWFREYEEANKEFSAKIQFGFWLFDNMRLLTEFVLEDPKNDQYVSRMLKIFVDIFHSPDTDITPSLN